jgi:methyl-accepting chemotaxis protein
MRLQNRFSIALGVTFLTSFVIVAVMFYRSALSQAEQEAMREARMILAAATAARTYASDRVTPLLTARPSEAFAPESVPSFAAQKVMQGFNAAFPEYSYRETALNPTNLDDQPRAWEADLIQRFRQDPALKELSGERTEAELLFYIAQPIRITDPGCLACHSEPKNAPASMVAVYGPLHGFGWKQDEVIGARFVVVPKSGRLALALSGVFWFLIALGCVLIVAVMVTIFMVQREVAGPVQRLAEQAERLSVGEHGAEEIVPEGAAEFRGLAAAINRLHRSLMLALGDAEDAPDRTRTRAGT